MKDQDYQENVPWEPEEENQDMADVYEIGSTRPPKSRSGLVAGVLIIGIVLGSVLSLLGGIRADLLSHLRQMENGAETEIPLRVERTEPTELPAEIVDPEHPTYPSQADMDLIGAPPASDTPSQPGGLPLQQIYEKNIPSVVSIISDGREGRSTGTGVVLSEDGLLITNAHVVEGAMQLTVILYDGSSRKAYLVGKDQISDLAVLYVQAEGLIPAAFGDSASLRVGDTVVAIGDPLGIELRGTMTNGIVSAINRNITVGGRTMTVIQTNAALNSGNSGGPLINCYGQVVGINTMKIGVSYNTGSVVGLGFAIPSTTVKTVVEELITQGYVSGRPGLGVSLTKVPNLYQYYYNVPAGLYVSEVLQPQENGLQVKDILVSVEGTQVHSVEDLHRMLQSYQVGDTVDAVIFRGNEELHLKLQLQETKS